MSRARILGALTALCWILFAVTGLIRLLAGSAGLWEGLMRRYAPAETTRLPETEYPAVARLVTDYLTGRTETFQHTFPGPDGAEYLCFQAHEQAHMADVRGLIRLDTAMMAVSLLAGLAATAAVIRLSRRTRGEALKPCAAGVRTLLTALAVLATLLLAWAALDFDGFFTAFHRVAFRNELWILNPRTDLLIRLMPEELFRVLGLLGLGLVLPVPVGLALWAWRRR